jgi:hypothetical protein
MDQGDIPGPLDSLGQLSLVPGTNARYPAGNDLALIGDESPQGSDIFVIDPPDLIFTKLADLTPAHKGHILVSFRESHLAGPGKGQARGCR